MSLRNNEKKRQAAKRSDGQSLKAERPVNKPATIPPFPSSITNQILYWKEENGVDSRRKDSQKSNKSKNTKPEPTKQLSLEQPLLDQFFPSENFQFIRESFQKRPVVSRSFDLAEVSNALCDLNIKRMLSQTASDQIHVWLGSSSQPADMNATGLRVLDSITVDDPEQAYKLYQAGHSLYCRAPHDFENQVVAKLANELHFGIKNARHSDRFRRGEVEMFFSRAGHFTDFHTDFQENFTMQLSGSKRWIFRTSTATHPLRGCTPHFKLTGKNLDVAEQQVKVLRLGNPSFEVSEYQQKSDSNDSTGVFSVVLQPGDIMYHPAGIWHRVECIDDSISINISLTAVSYADIFCGALQQVLLENPAWRSALFTPTGSATAHGMDAREVMQSLLNAVPAIAQSLRPEDLLPMPTLYEYLPAQESTEGQVSKKARKDPADGESEDGEEGSVDSGELDEEEMESDLEGLEEVVSDEEGDVGSEGDWEEVEDDEEDNEGDDGDEDEENERLRVVISEVAVEETLNLVHSSREDASEMTSKKRKRDTPEPSDTPDSVHFDFNPIAMLIEESDLPSGGSSSSSTTKFIVNHGFGNETLESACRVEVLVGEDYQPAMRTVQQWYVLYRTQRTQELRRYNDTAHASANAVNQLPRSRVVSVKEVSEESGVSSDLVLQLLVGLNQAGLLSRR